jgi:hypothetical protein
MPSRTAVGFAKGEPMPVVNLNPWSYAYIRKLAEEAAWYAQRDGLRPVLASEVLMNWRLRHRFNIPFLGDYIPDGWEQVHEDHQLFVDTTGTARPGEQTLTQQEFLQRVRDLASGDEAYAFGVVEQGQFQVLVATYRRKEEHGNSQEQT